MKVSSDGINFIVESTDKELVIGTISLMFVFGLLALASSAVLRFILLIGYMIYKSI